MASRASTGTWTATSNSFNPAVTGTTIDAGAWNAILDEIEVEITDSLSRSGKGGMLADLDMSAKNITNLASASAAHHAVRFDQLTDLSATLATRINTLSAEHTSLSAAHTTLSAAFTTLSAGLAQRDYLVLSANSNLDNARVLSVSGGLSANDTGTAGGTFTISLRPYSYDQGTGGTIGGVPPAAAGDATADKYLKADGTWTTPPGVGTAAPPAADYLVLSANSTLTAERVFTPGIGLVATDGGANSTYTLDVNVASAGEYWAASAGTILEASATWEAAKPVALTDAATVSVNFSLGINFTVTLAGNRALQNPTGTKEGQTGSIYISQSGGARTLSYGTAWRFAGGTAPSLSTSLSTASGAWDVLDYQVLSANFIRGSLSKNVK